MRGPILLAAVAALAACSGGETQAPKVAKGSEHVECALGPGTGFAKDCAIERNRTEGTYRMILRHPDGGFRRLEVDEGNAIVTTDGADAAQVVLKGAVAEVTVGEDRYRIPLERRTDAPKP